MTGGAAAAGMPGLIAGYLLRTTIVLTLALIASAVSRRRPAAVRHFILSFALIGLLLLPFLSLAPFGWRSSLVPRWLAPSSASTAAAIPAANAEKPAPPVSAGRTSGGPAGPVLTLDAESARDIAGAGPVIRAEEPGPAAHPVTGGADLAGRPERP